MSLVIHFRLGEEMGENQGCGAGAGLDARTHPGGIFTSVPESEPEPPEHFAGAQCLSRNRQEQGGSGSEKVQIKLDWSIVSACLTNLILTD